jgi:hypothetical protein
MRAAAEPQTRRELPSLPAAAAGRQLRTQFYQLISCWAAANGWDVSASVALEGYMIRFCPVQDSVHSNFLEKLDRR